MIYYGKNLIQNLVRQVLIIGRLYKWLNLDGVIFAARCLVWVKLMSRGSIRVAVMMSVVAEWIGINDIALQDGKFSLLTILIVEKDGFSSQYRSS